jgi:hypothetical protein
MFRFDEQAKIETSMKALNHIIISLVVALNARVTVSVCCAALIYELPVTYIDLLHSADMSQRCFHKNGSPLLLSDNI